MDYKEFSLGLPQVIGDTVWVCDYRHDDITEKPIRNIKPTEVVVVNNDDLPKNERVHYADIHFKPIGKNGEMLKKIIKPYDNTGYRSYAGVSLNIFFTKEDCIEKYKEQCEKIKEQINEAEALMLSRFEKMKSDLDKVVTDVEN